MISADLIGCSTARNKGTCDNRRSFQRERLEARVLNALRYHLMDPALFKEPWLSDTKRFRLQLNGELDEMIFAPIDEKEFNSRIRNPAAGVSKP